MEIVRAENNQYKDPGTVFMVPHYTSWRSMFPWPHLRWIDLCTVYRDKGKSMVYRFPLSEAVLWSTRFRVPLAGRACDGCVAVLDKDESAAAMSEYRAVVENARFSRRESK